MNETIIVNARSNVSSRVCDPARLQCWICGLLTTEPRRGDRVEVWEIEYELVQQGWTTVPGTGKPKARMVRRQVQKTLLADGQVVISGPRLGIKWTKTQIETWFTEIPLTPPQASADR